MRMQFKMVIEGNDSIYEKFQKTLRENPSIQQTLMQMMGQMIMLAFQLNPDDSPKIASFQAGLIVDEEKKPSLEEKKELTAAKDIEDTKNNNC